MKTVSFLLFSIVFIVGAAIGYVVKDLDTPTTSTTPKVFLDIIRSDEQKLSISIQKEDTKFFLLPLGVTIKRLDLRLPD